jgi:hypothetical protein
MSEDLISEAGSGERWESLNAVARGAVRFLGPAFTRVPGGHIQTDIAAASSVAGLMLLQESVANLEGLVAEIGPGNIMLSDLGGGQDTLFKFMVTYTVSNGIDAQGGWGDEVPEEQWPRLSCEVMTRHLAPPLYKLCSDQGLERVYWKFAATMTAINLVLAGSEIGLLDPLVGKALASYFAVAGSKTIPYPEALWAS